jgi:hypothetical protein
MFPLSDSAGRVGRKNILFFPPTIIKIHLSDKKDISFAL